MQYDALHSQLACKYITNRQPTPHLTAGKVRRMFSGLKAGAQPLRTAAHMALSGVVKKEGIEVGL